MLQTPSRRSISLRLTPGQVILISYILVILAGTILLALPFATRDGGSIGFFDALFTASSSVCVTGLAVLDTGTTFSLAGQIIILCLIQIGGLGFMTLTTSFFILFGKRITLRERLIMQESFNVHDLRGMVRLTRSIAFTTLAIEGIGALLFSFRFIPLYGWAKGLWFSVFHAISAFCNAGFDLFGNFQSLEGFRADPLINLVMMALIVLGGLGFCVLNDLRENRRSLRHINLHSRFALLATAILLVVGALYFCLAEWSNPATLGNLPFEQKIMAGSFQSVTLRTAGFNTVSQPGLYPASKLVSAVLMFIGASPASTGGGIKTTTAFILFYFMLATIQKRDQVTGMHRHIESGLVRRALALFVGAMALCIFAAITISLIEPLHRFTIEDILFEVLSAFGTVGVSALGTPSLTDRSQLILILLMFAGRVGLLNFMLALARGSAIKDSLHLPEGRVIIG